MDQWGAGRFWMRAEDRTKQICLEARDRPWGHGLATAEGVEEPPEWARGWQ